MSGKSWIIWTAMLTIAGLSGLWVVRAQDKKRAELTAQYRRQVSEGTQEYLASYEQWIRLSPEEKTENPWGQGKYGGPEIQNAISADQDKRLQAYIADLAGGQNCPAELANILYGSDWQQKVAQRQKDMELREMINWASSLAVAVGVLAGAFGTISQTVKKIIAYAGKNKTGENNRPNDTKKDIAEEQTHSNPDRLQETADDGYFEAYGKRQSAMPQRNYADTEQMPAIAGENTALALEDESPPQVCLWGQTDETSATTNAPAPNSISELTEEISAIRQFAASQQDQMRKLQDGYDWMLIRRFCLRIIRCVDNLFDRIEQLAKQGKDASLLQDIHDELVFALESSGVEQYRPDVGTIYKGLEKYVEAVRERRPNNQPQRSGHIASVIRCGYQYLVNEEDVKIVRCAQVQLYE